MLKQIGLDFKRIKLVDKIGYIQPNAYKPTLIKGNKEKLIYKFKDLELSFFKNSLGKLYENFISENAKSSFNVSLNDSFKTIWLRYTNKCDIVMNNSIEIGSNITATVILEHLADNSVQLGCNRIIVKEGASLNLIRFQGNDYNSNYIDETLIDVEERASLNIIDIQLGSDKSIINYSVNLLGFKSSCLINSMYLVSGEEGIDLSFTVNHHGKKSHSNILEKGVLFEKSKKVFRGTLSFEKGSTSSIGKEEEFVLLMDEEVKSDSIPALMCSEDDVVGEHGASIGKIDEDKLFYLMSRGLSEKQAKFLVVSSSFKEVLEKIEDNEFKNYTIEALDRRIKNVV